MISSHQIYDEENITKDFSVIFADEYLNGLNAESLEEECRSMLGNGVKKIILNFKKTELINSIGISIIISIIEKVKEAKAQICFCNLSKIHSDTFDMLGLTRHAYIFSSVDEALRDINPL